MNFFIFISDFHYFSHYITNESGIFGSLRSHSFSNCINGVSFLGGEQLPILLPIEFSIIRSNKILTCSAQIYSFRETFFSLRKQGITFEKGFSHLRVVSLLSFKLPHPITVAVLWEYPSLPAGKQIGLIFLENWTGASRVRTAISLYWNHRIQKL